MRLSPLSRSGKLLLKLRQEKRSRSSERIMDWSSVKVTLMSSAQIMVLLDTKPFQVNPSRMVLQNV